MECPLQWPAQARIVPHRFRHTYASEMLRAGVAFPPLTLTGESWPGLKPDDSSLACKSIWRILKRFRDRAWSRLAREFRNHHLGHPQGLYGGFRGRVPIARFRGVRVDGRHRVIQERSPLFRFRSWLRIEESVRIARHPRPKAAAAGGDRTALGDRLNRHGQQALCAAGTAVDFGLAINGVRLRPRTRRCPPPTARGC